MLAHYKKNLQAKLLLTGLLALFASFVRAQGLGELTLESALNEPLRASIELVNVAGINRDQLQVSIGTEAEYEQAGLEKHALLNGITMEVELQQGQQGRSRIILTTETRIQEPYLILLVSARWPTGRVMRDYTVLLDLPTFRAAGSGTAPLVAANTAPAPRAAANTGTSGSDTYTVATGDSLWEIAEQTRPSSAVPVQQMMIAIQRANEDAFINNNINRLLSGRVLRIPTAQEIGSIDQSTAVTQINTQNQELGLVRLDGSGAAAGSGGTRDELTVISADDAVAPGAGSSDLAATIAALENELMVSEEELDRVRFENENLNAQLEELEQQIAILQNIIAIEDERMASLQSELAEQAEQLPAQAAQSAMASNNVLSVTQQAPAQPQGLAGQVLAALQNNLVAIVAAVLVLLMVLGFLIHRARKMREFDDDDLAFMRQDDTARGATRIEEAEVGFLAGLLARFRRDKDDDDDDYDDEDDDDLEDEDEELDDEQDDEVSYLLDEETLVHPEEDFILDTQEADDFAPVVDAAGAKATGSLADELDELDFEDDDEEFLTDLTLDHEQAADNPVQSPDASSEVAREIEFDQSAADAKDAALAATTPPKKAEIETFEFKLAAKPEVSKPAATPASNAADVETIAFNSAGPKTEQRVADLEISGFEDTDLRLEDDAMGDDQEGGYQPRTNMDECDTKLDLAVAYEAMGDIDGAIEILDEVIAEGKPAQIEAARGFKAQWQES